MHAGMALMIAAIACTMVLFTFAVFNASRIAEEGIEKYQAPLREAILHVCTGKKVPHDYSPATDLVPGEVVTDWTGRMLGFVDGGCNSIMVIDEKGNHVGDKDWYRTGIVSDRLTWNLLWAMIREEIAYANAAKKQMA